MNIILFNFHDVVLFVNIFQCLILAGVFMLVKQKAVSAAFFIVFFFISTAAIPLDILMNFGAGFREWAIYNLPDWFYVFEFGYWLQGPLLLWYLRATIYKKYLLSRRDFIYILPFSLFAIHQLVSYHSLGSDVKASIQSQYNLLDESLVIMLITIAREFLRLFFGFLCVSELSKYSYSMKTRLAAHHDKSIAWLKVLVYGFVSLWAVGLIVALGVTLSTLTNISVDFGLLGLASNYAQLFLTGLVMIIVAVQSNAFDQMERLTAVNKEAISHSINPIYIRQLERLMEEERPYLDHTLTLERLANRLSISPRTLSKVINGYFNCNFFEFVNRYRIEEAKRLLLSESYRNSTVLDIMLEVGFNSKATFNNFFKKNEGITPREYKKRHLTKAA